jgi:anti-anti-sigma factor
VPITLHRNEEQCTVHLEGEIDIAGAAELKKLLLQALASGKQLRIDLEHATELDITALQLLLAAEREAHRSNLGFGLAGRLPEEISAAAMDAGFAKFLVPGDGKRGV